MSEGSIPVAMIYRIHYKIIKTAFKTNAKTQSIKGETLILHTEPIRANIVVPQLIRWRDITLPNDWLLENAAPSQDDQSQPSAKPNTKLSQITQFQDETVIFIFQRSQSKRFFDMTSISSTLDLERVSNIPSVINLSYDQRRHSSDLSNTYFQIANYTSRILHSVYAR